VVAYSPSDSWHDYHPRWNFISDSTINNADWKIQGPAFLAWQTARKFSVGLWELANFVTNDLIFLPEINGTTPAVSGFSAERITGQVYDSQICGSVPLLGVFNAAAGDHYYTTSATEHSGLISNGWIDAPTGAFVLPIPSGTSIQKLH